MAVSPELIETVGLLLGFQNESTLTLAEGQWSICWARNSSTPDCVSKPTTWPFYDDEGDGDGDGDDDYGWIDGWMRWMD